MFTGIVQTTGRVAAATQGEFSTRLAIDRGGWRPHEGREVQLGDSICVSGVCLTVAALDGETLGFDVIAETLDRTTLGGLSAGDRVNLEPSVTGSQPMGGHFVQGHVDGVGEVVAVKSDPDEWRVTLQPPAALMAYMIPKGSVTIDGVSLTLAAVDDTAGTIDVALIPTTLDLTTMGDYAQDTRVNLECDIVSKTIVTHLDRLRTRGDDEGASAITRELLADAGLTPPDAR